MKKVVHLLLLTLLPYFVFAQIKLVNNTKVEVGKPYPVIDAMEKHYIPQNDELYTFKKFKEELFVQKFNTESLSLETIRTYTDFPEHYVIEHIGVFFDKCLLFYSVWDKKNNKEQLFYRELDMETGQFINKGTFLFSVNDKVSGQHSATGKFYGIEISDKFKFECSYDDQNLLIRYRKRPIIKNDDKNYDVIGLHVYDIWMNSLWEKEVKMPYTEGKMDNLDYYVNDKAEVIILARVFNDNSHEMKIVKGRANYRLELLKITKDNSNITNTSISLGAKMINSISLFQTNDNNLILGGYYAEKKPGSADGLFCLNIDEDGKTLNKMTYEFPLSFLNQNATNKEERKNNRKGKKDKAEYVYLFMRKIVVSADGSVTLIGEQSYSVYVYNGRSSYTDYFYRDMVISKIDKSGKLLWNKKLPKFQKGRDSGRNDMSFKHFFGNGNHYFLFLDNVRNKDLKRDERPKIHSSGQGGWLTAYIVNSETGDVSKSYILDSREVKGIAVYQFNTHRISKISDNSFVVEVYKKKKEDVLIKVEIE